jgi:Tfp pilus assembly protein FimT
MADGTLKVGTITTSSGSGTITLGQSGETLSVPSGVSLSGGVANTPSFVAYKTSNQSISNTTFTKVTFDAEQLDSDSKYDTSNSRFTPGTAGYYFIGSIWRYDTGTDFDDARFILYRNGSAVIQTSVVSKDSQGTTFSAIVYSDADDYFEMYGRQDSGGSVNINGGSTYLSDSTQAQFFGFRIIGV